MIPLIIKTYKVINSQHMYLKLKDHENDQKFIRSFTTKDITSRDVLEKKSLGGRDFFQRLFSFFNLVEIFIKSVVIL